MDELTSKVFHRLIGFSGDKAILASEIVELVRSETRREVEKELVEKLNTLTGNREFLYGVYDSIKIVKNVCGVK